jgi:hypothetical protein
MAHQVQTRVAIGLDSPPRTLAVFSENGLEGAGRGSRPLGELHAALESFPSRRSGRPKKP